MGKTYRRSAEEDRLRKKPKHHNHANNRKTGGMRILNDIDYDEDFFDENVGVTDHIVINKTRE